MSEYGEIVRLHPLLVLISEKPSTWHGFLSIHGDTRVEIKFRVPHYPELQEASLQFGDEICLMHGTDFKAKVKDLLKSATSVVSFLRQLQGLMSTIIKPHNCGSVSKKISFHISMIEELKTLFNIPDIQVHGNKDLTVIKIIYNTISIILKPEDANNNPWTVISSDLPEVSGWEPLEKCVPSLIEAARNLKLRVDALEDIWRDLAIVDDNCWVIDPIKPNPCHLYRRIHVNPALSLLIKLNPLYADDFRDINLLGSDKEVFKYREILYENWNNWDNERTIPENIKNVLGLEDLPLRPMNESVDEGAIVSDEECCICFSMESDNGELPVEICNNEKCRKYFHSSCLLEWLQTIPGKQVYFDRCHGSCPICKENISCAIKVC